MRGMGYHPTKVKLAISQASARPLHFHPAHHTFPARSGWNMKVDETREAMDVR